MQDAINSLFSMYHQQGNTNIRNYHDNSHDDSGDIHSDSGYHSDAHDNNPNGFRV